LLRKFNVKANAMIAHASAANASCAENPRDRVLGLPVAWFSLPCQVAPDDSTAQ